MAETSNSRNQMTGRLHHAMQCHEMRSVYAACEIGSTVKIVNSKGVVHE